MKRGDIYGVDDNAYAARIASEALADSGQPDIHGRAIDQSAESEGNKPDDKGEAKAISNLTGDKRAKAEGN